MSLLAADSLLSPADPPPVEVVNADSTTPLLLLCEHAGQAIPQALGTLGIDADTLDSHRGWDIGAEALARQIATALNAPLVIQRYSRLVIDCNRPPGSLQSVPLVSDHREIPANAAASVEEKDARTREIFAPMDAALTRLFAAHPRRAAFSIHSFTPRMDGVDRPWHAGFLTRRATATGEALMRAVAAERPGLTLALNQPYQINDGTDWFIPRHAEARELPHSLIEVRNDQIDHPEGVRLWSGLLSRAIGGIMESLT